MKLRSILFFILINLVFCFLIKGQDIPDAPSIFTPVYDKASILNKSEIETISKNILSFEDSTRIQIQIVILDTLDGFSVQEYANKWANSWKIGQKDLNNGILLLIAMKDRKMRIEVGYGLEEKLTDRNASDIMKNYISPSFREKEYANGLLSGLDELEKHLSGYYLSQDKYSPFYDHSLDRKWYQLNGKERLNLIIILVFFIIYNYIIFVKYKKKRIKLNKTIVTEQVLWHLFGVLTLVIYLFLRSLY